ncbi:MAG TPA: N-acetylmuramoyl-L-alanine amidase [Patescibacteria group bacterium]|nr:N-acetylmuramoyl-L-alanine amidase [Patescibacteria group bacterium]
MIIVTDAPSPNFGPRAGGKQPTHLILHYTDTRTTFDALQILQNPERQVSSHYLVGDNGQVMRLVPEEMRAWHAGKSWWSGETDINSTSIGIEIQNPGHGFGYVPFPQVQMQAVAELCRDILSRHKILPYHVLAHSDIAPARKKDPGELFPWESLAKSHIGLWPRVTDRDEIEAEEMEGDNDRIKSYLTSYGYDPSLDLPVLLTAFQRHFEPEAFADETKIGIASLRTLARLKAVVRQRLALRPRIA